MHGHHLGAIHGFHREQIIYNMPLLFFVHIWEDIWSWAQYPMDNDTESVTQNVCFLISAVIFDGLYLCNQKELEHVRTSKKKFATSSFVFWTFWGAGVKADIQKTLSNRHTNSMFLLIYFSRFWFWIDIEPYKRLFDSAKTQETYKVRFSLPTCIIINGIYLNSDGNAPAILFYKLISLPYSSKVWTVES